MPYKSDAQRRFFNSETGKKKIGEKEVNKWNKESKGLKLPEKVGDEFNSNAINLNHNLNLASKIDSRFDKGEKIVTVSYLDYAGSKDEFERLLKNKYKFNVKSDGKGNMKITKDSVTVYKQFSPDVKIVTSSNGSSPYHLMKGNKLIASVGKGGIKRLEEEAKKLTSTKDAMGEYSLFVKEGSSYTFASNFKSNETPIKQCKEFMREHGYKEGLIVSKRTKKQWKIKDAEKVYDPITKTMKVKTLGANDAIYDNIVKFMRNDAGKIVSKYTKAIMNANTFEELDKISRDLSSMSGEANRMSDEFLKMSNGFSNAMSDERKEYNAAIDDLRADIIRKMTKIKNEK